MKETEKLITKKNSKKTKKYSEKLFDSQDNYGTLNKQYIVEDEYPRTHFSFLHCGVVSFAFIFCLVFITTSLLIGLPKVRQRYQELNSLNSTYNQTFYSSTVDKINF